MKVKLTSWMLLFSITILFAQNAEDKRKINFPDIPDYSQLQIHPVSYLCIS